ncbi:MAG: hypothetical protein FJX77_02210, partial [Armatimonadetes bacterium]|nr:hypothetical protein [Armatimonadota bacterium]
MAGVPAPSRAVFQEVAIHANVSLDGTEAALSVVCTLTAESEISVAVATEIRLEEFPTGEVVDPLTLFPGETHLVQSLTLPRVQLWQPGGGAPPPLYRAHLAVVEGERGVLDQRVIPFGVRDVRWSEEGAYRLRVNGAPVPFRVLDWDLAFPAAPAEQERLVRVVQDIGVTVLWVGGEFPGEEEFYRACDRVGLLVVRDLGSTPAAGAEAEEERLETLIRTRRSHPSLIGWSLARAAPEALREEVQAVAALEDPTRALLLWPPQGAILVPLPTEPGEGAVARVGRQYVL